MPYPQPLMLTHAQNQSTHRQQLNWSYPPHGFLPPPSTQPSPVHSQNIPSSQKPPHWPSHALPWPPPLPHWGHPATAPHHFPATFQIPTPAAGPSAAPPPWLTNPYPSVGTMSDTLTMPNHVPPPLQVASTSTSPPPRPTHAPKFCRQMAGRGRYLLHRPPSKTLAEHQPSSGCTTESMPTASPHAHASSLATQAPLPVPSHPATSRLTHTAALPTACAPQIDANRPLHLPGGPPRRQPAGPSLCDAPGKPPASVPQANPPLSGPDRHYSLTDALTHSHIPGLECAEAPAQPGSSLTNSSLGLNPSGGLTAGGVSWESSKSAEKKRELALKGHPATESDGRLLGESCTPNAACISALS